MQLLCMLSQFAVKSHIYLIDHTYVGGCPEKRMACMLYASYQQLYQEQKYACCMHVNIHVHRELIHETFRQNTLMLHGMCINMLFLPPLGCFRCVSYMHVQWRQKIVEFRGAEVRRRAALPCFSPASIELFIAMKSPDDSLLLSWVHSESLLSA